MKKIIPLSTPTMNGEEIVYVNEAFESNWITSLGPNVDAFEREICSVVGMTHGVALSSGTAAIHMAIKAAGVKPGDIVFCTDMTFAASCNPIKYEKAIPVFIDSEASSWNMCPKALEMAFLKYPHAKAVIAVNLYGTSADYSRISELCRHYGAVLIEDAAESLGSTLSGQQTGSFGDISILSFNGNKIITTSGGGMLIANDENIVEKVKFWATQARDPARHYQHSELGYNYRMSNVCAGIGRGQLKTLDLRVAQKTQIYDMYKAAFDDNIWIEMNPVPKNCISNHWLSCMTLAQGSSTSILTVIECLERENIESRPIWKPMSLQPYYKDCDFVFWGDKPVGHDIFDRGICLPSDVKMTRDEQAKVCEIILELSR